MTTLQVENLSGRSLRRVTTTLDARLHVLLALDPVGVDELVPLLDGSTAPRRGRVMLNGRNPHRDPELRRRMGSLWSTETLPPAPTVRQTLQNAIIPGSVVKATGLLLEQMGHGELMQRAPGELDTLETRLVALALALSKEELLSLLLTEPFTGQGPQTTSLVAKLVLEHATRIPVLIVTSSRASAQRLGGATAELGGGFWRTLPPRPPGRFTMRISGACLRPLAADILRRPRVHSLRIATQPDGHEEMWLETNDPNSVSLDLVCMAQQLGCRIWSVDTLEGIG
jgi:ABC-type thiamine transport system ATPase subunit